MNTADLRTKSISELQQELVELRKSQFSSRVSQAVGGSVAPHIYARLRKDIARVKTVLREKRVGESNE